VLFLNLGGQEIALLAIAVLLLFGAKRVPEVFRSLGQGIAEFKRASREVLRELEEDRPARPGQTPQRGPEGSTTPTEPTDASAPDNEARTGQ